MNVYFAAVRLASLGVLAVFLAVISGCSKAPETSTQTVKARPALVEVVSGQHGSELTFNGVVRSAQRADLAFRTSGRLTEILVEEGDTVRQGQILATLDSRDAKTAFDTAQIEFNEAEKNYIRAKTIFDQSQAISRADLDRITATYKLAKNRLDEAQRRLEYTRISAPFDGTITEKLVENFAQVQANEVILQLQNLADLEVMIEVPHRVMVTGARTNRAQAEVTAIPGQLFDLRLRTYSTQASNDSQTYSVVLGFEDLNGFRVMPGMSARVMPLSEPSADGADIITLPMTALVPDNQGSQYVWVVNPSNQAEKRFVDLGTTYRDRVVIEDNLRVGETVIIAGVASVTEGMEVDPYFDNGGAD